MWSRKPFQNESQRILVARKAIASPVTSRSAHNYSNFIQPQMGTRYPSYTSGYQITVRAGNFSSRNPLTPAEATIGHSSVVLQSPAGRREYNVAVNNYDQIKGKPLRSLATGTAAKVERTHQPISMTQPSQISIPISPTQYMNAKRYAERQSNMGTFVWHAGNNCVHFTHNTAQAAGVDVFSTSPFASPEQTRNQIHKLQIQQRLRK